MYSVVYCYVTVQNGEQSAAVMMVCDSFLFSCWKFGIKNLHCLNLIWSWF